MNYLKIVQLSEGDQTKREYCSFEMKMTSTGNKILKTEYLNNSCLDLPKTLNVGHQIKNEYCVSGRWSQKIEIEKSCQPLIGSF